MGGGGGSYSSSSNKAAPKVVEKKPKAVQGLSHSQLMAQWEANGRDEKTGKLLKHVETKAAWTKGQGYANAYLDIVNRAITSKVGDKFVRIEGSV